MSNKRLLSALEYPKIENVNLDEEKSVREVVCWLESNKFKRSDTKLLNSLKNVNTNDWNVAFEEYKTLMECPKFESQLEDVQWLLGNAVFLETAQNKSIYLKHAVENIKSSNVPSVVAENPLDKLDFRSKEFTERINKLAKSLNITPNPDSLITLKAVRKVVCTRLAPECVENPSKVIIEGTSFPFQEHNMGFDLHDPVLNQAAKVLRMLYINDLRDLQTKANELIVAVQNITANPKTDTKLGQVVKTLDEPWYLFEIWTK